MSRIRQENDWDTVDNWDTQEAWLQVIPNATRTLAWLTDQQLTPQAAATFTTEGLQDEIRNQGTAGSRAKILQIALYLKEKRNRERPKVHFYNPLPDSKGLSAIEFIHTFSDWYDRERPPNSQVFELVRSSAPSYYANDLSAREHELKDKPWPEIQDRVLAILDPHKNTAHYVQEFTNLSAKEGETVEDFLRRFKSYCPQIQRMSIEDFIRFSFINALPSAIRSWILTATATSGDEYDNLEALMDLVRKRFQNRKDAVLVLPSQRRSRHGFDRHKKGLDRKNDRHHLGHFDQRRKVDGTPSTQSNRPIRSEDSMSTNASSSDPRPKCSNCGKTGHTVTACWSRKRARLDAGKKPREANYIATGYNPKQERYPTYMRNMVNADSFDHGDKPAIYAVAAKLLNDTMEPGFGRWVSLPQIGDCPTTDLSLAGMQFTAQIDTGARNSFLSYGVLDQLPEDAYSFSDEETEAMMANGAIERLRIILIEMEHPGTRVRRLFPFGLLPREDDLILMGYDLISLLRLEIPLLSYDEVERALAPYQPSSIDSVLAEIEESRAIDYVQHPDAESLRARIEENLERNANTAAQHCTLPPIPILFKDPKVRATRSWDRQFPLPHDTQVKYEAQIQDWLRENILEEHFDNAPQPMDEHGYPAGQFNTRTFTVMSNKLRFVQDFVHLNRLIEDDTNDVPSTDVAFQRISRIRPAIFSKIDLRSAYLQMPLRECDRPLTAITCGNRRYRFVTAPLGLKHLPSLFQRRISGLLQDHNCSDFTHNYIDDLLVFSPDAETHVHHVQSVLDALTAASLTINKEKSHFFMTRVPFLGVILHPGGYAANIKRVVNMLEWKRPKTRKTLKSLLGTLNYFRRFIPRLSERAHCLYAIRGDKFEWTEEHETALRDIHTALVEHLPFLHFPLSGQTLELEVDASDTAIGGALFHTVNSEKRYISFHSRSLRPHEKNYSTPKKELLSAVYHIEFYRDYLIGNTFKLHVDNKAIVTALSSSDHQKRDRTMMGWMSTLSEYSFSVHHIPGDQNVLADCASRVQSIQPTTRSEAEIDAIIEEAHSLGHFGASVMASHITITKEITDIPDLQDRCLARTQRCPVCRRMNTRRIGYSPLREPTLRTPNMRWHVDTLHMTESPTGNRYILTVVDDFTRFVWISAAENKDARTVATHLIGIGSTFGFPKELKSDEGTEYVNSLITALNSATGTEHQVVLAYNHHANGLVERQNQTISDTLLKLSLDATSSTDRWDEFVNLAMLHLNGRIHTATKSTPFALMFGRGQFFAGPAAPEEGSADHSTDHWKDFWQTYNTAVVPFMHKTQRLKNRRKKKRKRTTTFEPGSLVMHRLLNRQNKRSPRAVGPFRVVKQLPNSEYVLQARDSQFHAAANFLHRARANESEELAPQFAEEPPLADDTNEIAVPVTPAVHQQSSVSSNDRYSFRPRKRPRLTQL